MRVLPALALLYVAALLWGRPATAAEVKVLTSGAFRPVVLALAPEFEQQMGGDTVTVATDTAGGVLRRAEAGEAFDVVVLTPAGLAELAAKGKVAAGTAMDLARVGIGAAVKAGAPRPDIGSVDAFRRALLEAPSVAYIDPATGGSSGIYIAQLLQRLGIADAVRAKTVLVPGGLVAERVARGEAAIGLQQISELLAVPGVALVGPLPAEVQIYTVYAGGIGAAQQTEAARKLLTLLAGDGARRVLAEKGMEPPGPRR